MAIGLHTAGSWSYAASGSITPTLPTHSTGDMLLARVAVKSSAIATMDITCATAGWARVGQFRNGTTNSGNGTGSVQVAAFWKVATSGAETNPQIDFSQANTQAGAEAQAYSKAAGETWVTPVGDGGPDTTSGTSHSATIQSHVSATAGDLIDFFTGIADDTTMTVPTFTQTGLTLAAVVESPAAAGTDTSGADGAYDGGYRIVNSGTSSAAAVVTGTLSTSETGTSWTTRLRVQVATDAAAGLASGTGSALVASILLTVSVALSSGTGAANNASINVQPNANVATGTGAANSATADHVQSPNVATGTGASNQPSIAIGVNAGYSTYSTVVLADTPVAYWRMGESSGLPQDSSGNAHHATVAVGTATYGAQGAIAGGTNTAITFDGSTNDFTVPNNAGLNFTNGPLSVEVWAKLGADTANLRFILYRGTNAYSIGIGATDKFFFAKAGVAQIATESGTTTDVGTYHHFVATYAGTGSANVHIYKDGVDVTAYIGDQTLANAATALGIANTGAGGTLRYPGTIDELAVYNVVLTPTQIRQHYQAGLGSVGGSGASNNATVLTGKAADAGLASGTGTANNPTPNLASNGGAGTGSGTAGGPSSSVAVGPGLSSGTGTANNATVSTASFTNAAAGLAAGTGAANNPSSSVAPSGGLGSGTGTSNRPAGAIATNAAAGSGTGSAGGVHPDVDGAPNIATGTGAAGASSPAIGVHAGAAAGTGAAHNATANTGQAFTDVDAGVASGSGTAYNASVSTVTVSDRSRGGRTVIPRRKKVEAFPEYAEGVGVAYDATIEWNDDEFALALLLGAAEL